MHELLFDAFQQAFAYYVGKQLELAIQEGKEPSKVYQILRNDCRGYFYHLGNLRRESVRQARQTLSNETIRDAIRDVRRKRNII